MGKKVLIISSSPRIGGNSDLLCDAFFKGAAAAGNQVEKITLAGKKIGFCQACHACQNGTCPQHDDAPGIIEKMESADVIVLGTPVYFYMMSGQLKTLIDRSVMAFPNITHKTFYYILAMADTEEENFQRPVEGLRAFVACCEESTEAGMICAPGVYEKGTVHDQPICQKAFEMGQSIK